MNSLSHQHTVESRISQAVHWQWDSHQSRNVTSALPLFLNYVKWYLVFFHLLCYFLY